MVAVAILSIAIAAIIQLYSLNLKSTLKSESYTRATIIARSFMDETLSREDLDQVGGSVDRVDELYKVTRSVTALAGEEKDTALSYEITVQVSFPGGVVELKARKSIPKEQKKM